jgi:geranylgeranyl diphosphate synthase type I
VHARLRELGLALGMAFQVRDDILGIWGDPAQTGKPAGSDIARRKKTYPIVFAAEKAEGGLGERLRRLCPAPRLQPRQVEAVVSLLEQAGAREAAQQLVERFSRQALTQLEELGFPVETSTGFRQMITGLVGRST